MHQLHPIGRNRLIAPLRPSCLTLMSQSKPLERNLYGRLASCVGIFVFWRQSISTRLKWLPSPGTMRSVEKHTPGSLLALASS